MVKKKDQKKVAFSSESKDLFNSGLEYFQQGKIKDCIRVFESLLTSFPKDPLRMVTSINLASCYLNTKNYQKTYQILTSLIEASKVEKFDSVLLSKAHRILASLYETMQFYALAVKEYNIALSINPNENFSKERLNHLSNNKCFIEDGILAVHIDFNGELSLIFGCNHLSTLKEFIIQNINDIWSKLAIAIAAVKNSEYQGIWKIVIQTFLEYKVAEVPFEQLKILDADWLQELFSNFFSNPNNYLVCGIQAELLNNLGYPKEAFDEVEACNLGKGQFDDTIMNEKEKFYYDNVTKSIINKGSEDYNLWRACISGDSEKVESLLKEGANPDARNKEGETPLIWVSDYDNDLRLDIAEILIRYGADVNAEDQFETPLIAACEGNYKTAKLLIDNGADVNAVGKDKSTPLGVARSKKREDIVQLLLENGAIDRKKIEKNKQTEIDQIFETLVTSDLENLVKLYGFPDNNSFDLVYHLIQICFDQAIKLGKEFNFQTSLSYYKKAVKCSEIILHANYRSSNIFMEKLETVKRNLASLYHNLAMVYNELAILHCGKNDPIYKDIYKTAEECLEKTLGINPKSASAYFGLCHIHYGLKDFKKAIKFCEDAMRLEPQNEHIQNFLRVVKAAEIKGDWIGHGDFELYSQDIEREKEVNSNLQKKHMNNKTSEDNSCDKVAEEFRQAIRINPNDSEAHYNLGVAFLSKGQFDDAIKEFRQAIRINPNYSKAHYSLGVTFLSKGQFDDAIEEFRQAIRINPNYSKAYYRLGFAFFSKSQFDDAIANSDKAIELNPTFAEAYLNRGIVYTAKQDYDKAIANSDKAIELNPNFAEAYLNRGIVYTAKQDYDKAIADYGKAIELNQGYADANLNHYFAETYLNRGNRYAERQDYDKAIADYNKAIELNPDFAIAYFNRGKDYAEIQDYDMAIADYDKVIELNSDFVAEAYLNRGAAYAEKQDYDRAIADYDKVIELNPDFVAEAYLNRGTAYADKQDCDMAIADYDKVIELNPDYATAYYSRGDIHARQKKYDNAIADYDKAIKLKPDYATAYNSRGNTHALKKKYDNAITDYSKAIELKPDFAIAYFNRGNAYSDKHNFDSAIADYTKAIELKPDFSEAYTMRENAYSVYEHTKAIADFDKALELNPKEKPIYETIDDKELQKRFISNNMKFMATLQESLQFIIKDNFKQAIKIINDGLLSEDDCITGNIELDLQLITLSYCGQCLDFFTDDLSICEGIFKRGLNYGKYFLRPGCSPHIVFMFSQMVFEIILLYKDKKGQNDLKKARSYFDEGINILHSFLGAEKIDPDTFATNLKSFYLLSMMYWAADDTIESDKLLGAGLRVAENFKTEHYKESKMLQDVVMMLTMEEMRRIGEGARRDLGSGRELGS